MKRKLVIAAVVASAAIAGGTAAAFAGDDARTAADAPTARTAPKAPGSTGVTAAEAITAALESRPGTAVSAELGTEAGDDDRGWEVRILGTGTTSYDVLVDPATGRVLGTRAADDGADDVREARALLEGAGVTAAEAAQSAAAKGFVTSVDLEDDGAGAWEAETGGSSAKERDWNVGLKDGKLTADRQDDRAGDADDTGADD